MLISEEAKRLEALFNWHRENNVPIDPAYLEQARNLGVKVAGLRFEFDVPRAAKGGGGLYGDL